MITKIIKNIIEIIAITIILLISMGAYADDKSSQQHTKYEVKSDVLNFEYSEMAYPFKTVSIGINENSFDIPKKLVRGKEKEEDIGTWLKNGILDFLGFVIIFVSTFFLAVFLVSVIEFLFTIVMKIMA